jgi:hypothetical protein
MTLTSTFDPAAVAISSVSTFSRRDDSEPMLATV